ncbi:MAG TPA: TolC family outer membrane protein [Fluviicoccus sp.]|nr:TolC family outer membrane protein [Fluviicoccus sp.]
MHRILAASLLSFALSPLCHAIDLAQAYDLALKNDPEWAASTNAYKAEMLREGQNSGALLPTVGLSASYANNNFSPDMGASTTYNSVQYGLQVRQPLYRADLWRDYQRAKSSSSASEANYRQKQQELVLKVSEAYINVLRAQETLSTTQAEEAALKRQLEQAQKRFEVGLIAKTDVLEAQAQLDGAVANRISAEVGVANTREVLTAIIGKDPGTLSELRKDFAVTPPLPASADEWAEMARSKNPQLTAARMNQEAAERTLSAQRAGHLPQLDLVASYSNTDNKTSNLSLASRNGDATSIGVELQLPLYAGGRTNNAISQASYQSDAARDQVTAVERQLTAQARTAYLNASADSYRVAARSQAVKSTEAALAATKAGYDVGTRNIVDVLLAERNLYATRRDHANAKYDYLINTLKLRSASGQLSVQDIQSLNGWLQ